MVDPFFFSVGENFITVYFQLKLKVYVTNLHHKD